LGREYAVIGVEQDSQDGRRIIDALNSGVFPIMADDPKIYDYFDESRRKGNFFATFDPSAYGAADIIIVDINLDVIKSSDEADALNGYEVDFTPFIGAMQTIGRNCREDVLVLVESTVPPGACRQVIAPALRTALEERGLTSGRIRIGHSFERVMPGPNYIDSIQSFYRVFSGIDEASADAVEAFLHTIICTDEYPLVRFDNTNATEMAKVLENSYRAMNIAFITEWSRMAEEAGVDLYDIVNAIRMRPTHSNMMFPGLGVGGYCLTKDPLLASWSRSHLLGGEGGLPQSEAAVSINDQMPRFAFEFLERRYSGSIKDQRVLLLGVSYRGDVGDTRFSPVELFYRRLVSAKASISAHDPYVRDWRETGIRPEVFLSNALAVDPHITIITSGHRCYKQEETIAALLAAKPMWVYDTIGLLSQEQLSKLREKHTVIVLGRGDL
jgi:nucleotide sugar dehydrogenase